jgi:hypothetical protein
VKTSWTVLEAGQSIPIQVKRGDYLFWRYTRSKSGGTSYGVQDYNSLDLAWKFVDGPTYHWPKLEDDTGAGAFANLSGPWTMGGPYNVGKGCQIIQSGNSLTFVNENGQKSRGGFRSRNVVIAYDWNNLLGDITSDGNRINWRNKTWWIRGGAGTGGSLRCPQCHPSPMCLCTLGVHNDACPATKP